MARDRVVQVVAKRARGHVNRTTGTGTGTALLNHLFPPLHFPAEQDVDLVTQWAHTYSYDAVMDTSIPAHLRQVRVKPQTIYNDI